MRWRGLGETDEVIIDCAAYVNGERVDVDPDPASLSRWSPSPPPESAERSYSKSARARVAQDRAIEADSATSPLNLVSLRLEVTAELIGPRFLGQVESSKGLPTPSP